MGKKSFIKLLFKQSTELAGVGYSSVGGPNKDGIYPSVPIEHVEDPNYEDMVKFGMIEQLGDGEEPAEAVATVEPGHRAAFLASGMAEDQWLGLAPVDRDALAQAHAVEISKRQAEDATGAIASATATNMQNAESAPAVRAKEAAAQTAASKRALQASERVQKPAAPAAKKPAASAKAKR